MDWSIRDVAWVGDGHIKGPIMGVVLFFHGLGITIKQHIEWQDLILVEWIQGHLKAP